METKKEEWEIPSFANHSNNVYMQKLEEYERQKNAKEEKKQCYKIGFVFIGLFVLCVLIVGFFEGRF